MTKEFAIPEPHAAFRFAVEIGSKIEAVFTECKLPDIEIETQEIKEGGLNTHTHFLPGRRKGHKFTLKNGVGHGENLWKWTLEGLYNGKVSRQNVTIILYNVKHDEIMRWNLIKAFPIKWTGPQLNTGENAVALQTLELACEGATAELQKDSFPGTGGVIGTGGTEKK
jgi:phage tail-like protein